MDAEYEELVSGLKFTNLTVCTREQKSWRRKVIKRSVTLIKNVSGEIRNGDFVAVIGPSGAGKTTFLVSLAGKCNLPSTGSVVYNNKSIDELEKGMVEIVPQFEVFVESLSVFEHLNFMMEMKLCTSVRLIKMQALNDLLTLLKLKANAYTMIKSLSGGQRRLLSLATSLISNPKIIICDEPTTGLDIYNATLVVDVLKSLSDAGNIVVCSVHQPSSDIFNMFTSIILLADGHLIMHGNQSLCKEVFESVQLNCPKNYNPAEFYIRAISNNNNIKLLSSAYEEYTRDFEEVNKEYNLAVVHIPFKICKRNWFMQIWLLVWRSSLTLKRNKWKHLFELLTGVLISALIIGCVYVGISGTTQQGVQDIRGLLWLLTSEVAFSIGYSSLTAFEFDLTLFKREAGMYSSSAYYISRVICLTLKCIIWPISYVSIAIIFVNIPNTIITGIGWAVALMATGLASASYGLSLAALFTSSHLTTEVMPCFDALLVLMSGAFMRISTIPIWLHGFKYVSHFYYGMDAISNIYWRQISNIDCSWNATVCIKDGITALAESGYSTNTAVLGFDSLGLFLVTLGWCFLGYLGLWREEKKGFAY